MGDDPPIEVTIPGHPDDPRAAPERLAGVDVDYVPDLHPDDVAVSTGRGDPRGRPRGGL